nr:hypothetical protein [Pseudomonadota bacterium]
GAVGIFASNSAATTAYVGGFVAERFDSAVDCVADADPFNPLCTDNDDVKLQLCGGTIAALTNVGGSAAKCKAPALSGMICGMTSTAGSNPFAPICFDAMALVDGFTETIANSARKTLANSCSQDPSPTGCGNSITGVASGISVRDCVAKPYATTDGCNTNKAIDGVRLALDYKCLSGGTNPFDGDCTSSEYPNLVAQQQGYCSDAGNTWKMTCDTHRSVAGVMTARATICLANGSIDTEGGTNVVAGSSLFNAACNDLATASKTVLEERMDLAALCTTTPADMKCDAVVDPTAKSGAGVTVRDCGNHRTEGDPFQDGCKFFIEAFRVQQLARAEECTIGDSARMSFCANAILVNNCIENPHGDGCVDTTAQTVRDEFCRGNDANPSDTLCDARQAVICASGDTPFASTCGTGTMAQSDFCNNNADESDVNCDNGGYTATICETASATNVFARLCTDANRMTFCTTGNTNVFNSSCTADHGDVAKARAVACKTGNAIDPATNNEPTGCGGELVDNGNFVYTYCNSQDGLQDETNCSDTRMAAANSDCIANPWGTGGGSACDPTQYYSQRLAFCAPDVTLPDGVERATVCPLLAEITCKNGGTGITADPFHENCFVGDTYANDRATACRDNTQG